MSLCVSTAPLFDQLLTACKAGDMRAIEYLETTDLDFAGGLDVPLLVAIENNHIEIAKRLAHRAPETVLLAVQALSEHPLRSEWLAALLPLARFPEVSDIQHRSQDCMAYCLLSLTPNELDLLRPSIERDSKCIADDIIKKGLSWLWEYTSCGDNQYAVTVWAVGMFATRTIWQDVFEKAVGMGKSQCAVYVAQHCDVRFSHRCFGDMFDQADTHMLKTYAPLFTPKYCQDVDVEHFIHEVVDREYRNLLPDWTDKSRICEIVKILVPLYRLLDIRSLKTMVLQTLEEFQGPVLEFVCSEFSDVLNDGDEVYTALLKNNCFKSIGGHTPLLQNVVFSNHQKECEALALAISASPRRTFIYQYPAHTYQNPIVAQACLQSQSPALVEKMLHEGGAISCCADLAKLIKWASPAFLGKIVKRHIDPAIFLLDINKEDIQTIFSCASMAVFLTKDVLEHVKKTSDGDTIFEIALKSENLPLLRDVVTLLDFSEGRHGRESDPVVRAVRSNASVQSMKIVTEHWDAAAQNSFALKAAVSEGYLNLVEFLLPLSNPMCDNCEALVLAASLGNLDMVKILCPVSDPKVSRSLSLVRAVENSHAEVAEFLLPLSNIDAARTKLDENESLFLDQCISNHQHKMLSAVVGGNTSLAKPRLM